MSKIIEQLEKAILEDKSKNVERTKLRMKQALPLFKALKKEIEDTGQPFDSTIGICGNAHLQFPYNDACCYLSVFVISKMWPKVHRENSGEINTSHPIAGPWEENEDKWTKNRTKRLELLDFAIDVLEKIE